MSNYDKEKWNSRYAKADRQAVRPASELLQAHLALARPGRALDVACGTGRNAFFLAHRGFTVDAIDISEVALSHASAQAEGLPVRWLCQDLLASPEIPQFGYDLIIMFHFVAPTLLARLTGHLSPGGLLMVEEHLQPPEGRGGGAVTGPHNPQYRVGPGELQQDLNELDLLFFYEGEVKEADDRSAWLSQVIVRNPE